MRHRTRSFAALTGGFVLLGLLAPAATAAPSTQRSTVQRSTSTAAPTHSTPHRLVTRLIVKTRDGAAPSSRLRSEAARLAGLASAPTVGVRTGGKTLLALGPGLSVEAAWKVAHALSTRSDVVYAEPDLPVYATASPLVPNDPYFVDQWDMHSATALSTEAATVWGRTHGHSDVVVAVLDTGLTVHPDLVSSVAHPAASDPIVPGYDFVSLDNVALTSTPLLRPWTANDGNGRDADPSDPGDWISAADDAGLTANGWFQNCAFHAGGDASSWHGTHVTGTIVARQGNGIGISGLAPGVKVQPVRVLGKCGGSASDIDDAITWASGGHIDGVPDNATPADVISMSLGGSGACLPSTHDAIAAARSRGTTVVVAAGNESTATWSADPAGGSEPGNCAGVVSVVASSRTADGALADFSNYGDVPGSLTVAAPGVDILSTVNAGTTTPTTGAYDLMSGTSMATPHVAAEVALLQSLRGERGRLDPSEIDTALAAMGTITPACPASACGVGVVGFGATGQNAPLYTPTAPVLSAQPKSSSVALSWQTADDGGSPASYAVQQSTDGTTWVDTVISGVTSTSGEIAGLIPGQPYSFRVVATNSTGSAASAAVGPEAPSSYAVQAVAAAGGVERIDVTWTSPEAGDVSGYQMRWREVGALTWTYLAAPVVSTQVAQAVPAGRYEVQVAAQHPGSDPDPSTWEYSHAHVATVSGLVQRLTQSASVLRPFRDGFQDSIVFKVTSNRSGGTSGSLRIYDAKLKLVKVVPLAAGSSWAYRWTGLNSRNVRVPNGRYYVKALLAARAGAAPATLSLLVAASTASKPVVSLTSTKLFPYRDRYLDSITIRATSNVPALMSMKLVRAGKTYWTTGFARSTAVARVYAGTTTVRGGLPAGTYVLYVYARGGEGATTVSYKYVVVSRKHLVAHPFSTTPYASTVFRGGLGSGSLGTSSPGFVQIPQRSIAVFTTALPASVVPVTSLTVEALSDGDTDVFPSQMIGGYFLGSPENPETLRWDPVDLGISEFSAPTTTAVTSGNLARWYLFNLQSSSPSKWRVSMFSVTCTYYTLA